MITAHLPIPVMHSRPVPASGSPRPDPSAYEDYRLLLRDLYEVRKRKDRHFSYRFIARRAGFKSVGFFSQIVHGNTDISQSTLLRLAQVFDLTGEDLERFEALVWWNQAKTSLEREHFHRRFESLRRHTTAAESVDPSPLHCRWYLTLRLSESGMRRLREEVSTFRARELALAGPETDPDQVCQVTLHAYPVARNAESRSGDFDRAGRMGRHGRGDASEQESARALAPPGA
jgi:transcriptional regulator with XRE-family HTH domain